jgi:hypothetical protein
MVQIDGTILVRLGDMVSDRESITLRCRVGEAEREQTLYNYNKSG